MYQLAGAVKYLRCVLFMDTQQAWEKEEVSTSDNAVSLALGPNHLQAVV
jgi:hypothetical protein